MSPRTDDRLRYCTNIGSVPSKLYTLDCLKHLKFSDDDLTKSPQCPIVPIIFPRMQKSSVLSKRFYPSNLRTHSKSAQRKAAKHKKTSRGKVLQRESGALFKENNLEAKKGHSGLRKRLAAKKVITAVLSHLSNLEQFVLVSVSVNNNKKLNSQSVTNQ